MTFRYFAYGSNLWPPRMRTRCPSAKILGAATLHGWTAAYDKPSVDGSAKLNIRPTDSGEVDGVIYEIDDDERQRLDAAEPRYTPIEVTIDGEPVLTYTFEGEPFDGAPYDWYVETVAAGVRYHDIDPPSVDRLQNSSAGLRRFLGFGDPLAVQTG